MGRLSGSRAALRARSKDSVTMALMCGSIACERVIAASITSPTPQLAGLRMAAAVATPSSSASGPGAGCEPPAPAQPPRMAAVGVATAACSSSRRVMRCFIAPPAVVSFVWPAPVVPGP